MSRPRSDTHIVTPYQVLQMRQTLRVACLSCRHEAVVDVVNLIDRGLGDVPLTKFKFRCSKCGGTLANPRLDRFATY